MNTRKQNSQIHHQADTASAWQQLKGHNETGCEKNTPAAFHSPYEANQCGMQSLALFFLFLATSLCCRHLPHMTVVFHLLI